MNLLPDNCSAVSDLNIQMPAARAVTLIYIFTYNFYYIIIIDINVVILVDSISDSKKFYANR